MYIDYSSDGCFIINPSGIIGLQIYTAMTHKRSKIVVPVGTMNTIAFIKIHNIGNAGQVIARTSHIC